MCIATVAIPITATGPEWDVLECSNQSMTLDIFSTCLNVSTSIFGPRECSVFDANPQDSLGLRPCIHVGDYLVPSSPGLGRKFWAHRPTLPFIYKQLVVRQGSFCIRQYSLAFFKFSLTAPFVSLALKNLYICECERSFIS